MEWMSFALSSTASGAYFCLQDVFHISVTNDLVLEVTPLIYKVETNRVTAHLVEFAPIRIKLTADGKVQKP